jgi:chloramphenicol-sensitive protein RarD
MWTDLDFVTGVYLATVKGVSGMNKGMLYALGAYIMWGLFPIYWKWLQDVPALQVIGHRIGWSFVLLMLVIVGTRQWTKFRSTLTPRVLGIYFVAGLLLSVNWLIYVWGVNAGRIVETSLGYFINPLLSVLLGMIFLGERLRPAQWFAVGLAAFGVIYLTWTYGSLPWIALSLAFTFGLYGLLKKIAPLGSLYGLTLVFGSTVYNGKNAEIWDVSERTLAHIPNFGSLSRQRRKNRSLPGASPGSLPRWRSGRL